MKNIFLLGALLIPTIVYSANDLERWNSEVGRTVRQAQSEKLAQTTYSEISSKNVTVSQDRKTVYPQIETHAQVAGSRTRVVAEATLVVDKDKVWRDWNNKLSKFGRGTAAGLAAGAIVQGIVDGVGWVIDEGGKVNKKPVQDNTNPHLQNCYQWNGNCVASMAEAVTISRAYSVENYPSYNITSHKVVGGTVYFYDKDGRTVDLYTWGYGKNPNYNPSAPPENVEVTQEQLTEALKNALESNNPALAAAIAEAIKAAYTPEGPLLASIGDEQANGLAVDAADTARDAVNKASKNTGSEPSSKGKPGYYNITDGDKTIEGNVYETTPTGTITPQPDTGTGTEPGTGTGTGTGTSTGGATLELPAFCEWAGIVCDFIEWYKTQPEDDSPELPEHELEKKEIDKDLLNVGGSSCPQDLTVNWTGLPFGITINESIEMQPYCNELEPLKYVFILITTCLCAFMFVRL